MTIEEAVGLVLEAARMADGTATYVLDMGEPVKIVELVRNFARLLSIPEVDFRFTGLRPGEKLSEELFGDGEHRVPTAHPRISMARAAAAGARFPLRPAAAVRRSEPQPSRRGAQPPARPGAGVHAATETAGPRARADPAIYPDDY